MCGARRAAKAAPHDERGARGGAPCTHTRAHQGCAPDLGAAGVCTSPRSSIDTLGAGLFIISAVSLCNSRPVDVSDTNISGNVSGRGVSC
jgi:hypothetical protein